MKAVKMGRYDIKINLLTTSRFYMADLARELIKQGYDVKYYSIVPKKRIRQFGVAPECISNVWLLLAPFTVIHRCFCKFFSSVELEENMYRRLIDGVMNICMRKADITMAMSGSFLKTLIKSKKRGDIVLLGRGSAHILEQKDILDAISNHKRSAVSEETVYREIRGYEIADKVIIPSTFVKESFLKHQFPEKKLFMDTYGTNLEVFYPMLDVEREYDIIMVGIWGLQKGCDVLTRAVRDTGLKLLHIGKLDDLTFPKEPQFTHIDHCDTFSLRKYYNRAKIFAMPSRQDGFGAVFLEALACGLPIVCTTNTGGADIRNRLENEKWVIVVPPDDAEALRSGLLSALSLYETLPPDHNILGNAREFFSWEDYGKRHAVFLDAFIKDCNPDRYANNMGR